MIDRTYPISKFIFLSIISHGLLIFLMMSFWELNFPLGSVVYSNVTKVMLIGEETEETPSLLESDDLTPSKPSQKERASSIGLEIDEQIVPIENNNMETPFEIYQKVESNLNLDQEVNQGSFISQEISLLSKPVQKDEEAFTVMENEESFKDFPLSSFSNEESLVKAEKNLPEGIAEWSQWEKDPEWTSYQMELVRQIERGKRYPLFAKMWNMSGVVVVGFTIGVEGRARDIEVIRSSDQKILDREALDTIRRVSPFPPFPEGFRLPRMNLSISLKFDLEKS